MCFNRSLISPLHSPDLFRGETSDPSPVVHIGTGRAALTLPRPKAGE